MRNRRKHFLIDRPFQFRYMFRILLILLTVSGAIFFSLYFAVWGQALREFSDDQIRNTLETTSRLHDYETARFNQPETSPRLVFIQETELFSQRQREIIREILRRSHKRLLILILPLFILIGWGSIFISHKIAGPLYHLDRILKLLKEKDLTLRVRFRKGDETHHIAEDFNAALQELDESLSRMKEISRNQTDPQTFKNAISEELARFKTSND